MGALGKLPVNFLRLLKGDAPEHTAIGVVPIFIGGNSFAVLLFPIENLALICSFFSILGA